MFVTLRETRKSGPRVAAAQFSARPRRGARKLGDGLLRPRGRATGRIWLYEVALEEGNFLSFHGIAGYSQLFSFQSFNKIFEKRCFKDSTIYECLNMHLNISLVMVIYYSFRTHSRKKHLTYCKNTKLECFFTLE